MIRICFLATLSTLSTLAACGASDDDDDDVSIAAACRRSEECYAELGGQPDDYDVDQCIADMEESYDEAESADCGREFNNALGCSTDMDCDDSTGCDPEFSAYIDCMIPAASSSTG